MNGISANYPIAATLTNFNTNTQGSLTAGNNTVSYSVSAELLVMRQVRSAKICRTSPHNCGGSLRTETSESSLPLCVTRK